MIALLFYNKTQGSFNGFKTFQKKFIKNYVWDLVNLVVFYVVF